MDMSAMLKSAYSCPSTSRRRDPLAVSMNSGGWSYDVRSQLIGTPFGITACPEAHSSRLRGRRSTPVACGHEPGRRLDVTQVLPLAPTHPEDRIEAHPAGTDPDDRTMLARRCRTGPAGPAASRQAAPKRAWSVGDGTSRTSVAGRRRARGLSNLERNGASTSECCSARPIPRTVREKTMSINAHHHGNGVFPAAASPSASSDDQPDSSQAAARMLEKIANETDQWRSDARDEAAAIVAGARAEAEKLVQAARDEAGRLVTTARAEADGLVASARDEATQTVDSARAEAHRVQEETRAVRRRHDEAVAQLQQLTTEHRTRLRSHLTEMIGRVDSLPGGDTQ